MRILFTVLGNSRRSNYLDGDTLRYGKAGGSGTDTSTILIAEYLASQGHEVVIASDKFEPALEQEYAKNNSFFNKILEDPANMPRDHLSQKLFYTELVP